VRHRARSSRKRGFGSWIAPAAAGSGVIKARYFDRKIPGFAALQRAGGLNLTFGAVWPIFERYLYNHFVF